MDLITQPLIPKKVYIPNGDVSHLKYTSTNVVTHTNTIHNVFHILDFRFNLLFISKVIKQLQCSVTFFLDFFLFQNLFNEKVEMIIKGK